MGIGVARTGRSAPAVAAVPGQPSDENTVRTPRVLCRDVSSITPTLDGDIKVFHLRAKPAETHFMPGRAVDYWGFNGSMLGPTIEVNEGDRLRFIVENGLPDVFSMHWHGLEVPIEMDGVPGLTQDPIQPGGSFVYEFTVH